MKKIRIGVLCPSEIAFRRFMPALNRLEDFDYIGISVASEKEWFGKGSSDAAVSDEVKKAEAFSAEYGGKIFCGYEKLITSDEIDAIYIPLPPELHFRWARLALESNKHVLLEKPFTTSAEKTKTLISIAKANKLALHENYMFAFHSQLEFIKKCIQSGDIGDIRLIRIDFGFPFRGTNDFRYDKRLGGGSLLDCGGYTLKLASDFLGETAKVSASQLNSKKGFDVDIYGSATLVNDEGLTAQVSFGMDNSYRCSLDIWGSSGSIYTNRILTAPVGYHPVVTIKNADGDKSFTLDDDDCFKKSIEWFEKCISCEDVRYAHYDNIYRQALLVDSIKEFGE